MGRTFAIGGGAIAAIALLVTAAAPAGVAGKPQAPSAAQSADTPTALLERIYAKFRKGSRNSLDPMQPPGDARAFDPQLVRLLREETALSKDPQADPEGFFDEDIFCECQDTNHFRARIQLLSSAGDHARAEAQISDTGRRAVVRFDFVRVAGQWRIADIISSDGSSLRKDLTAYLRAAHR
ncbi:MAG: hypothetical protein ACHP84_03755 [Caulobacterales bacterium]